MRFTSPNTNWALDDFKNYCWSIHVDSSYRTDETHNMLTYFADKRGENYDDLKVLTIFFHICYIILIL